ncbi:hypothetical protein PGT21_028745 [Puccinia graminis f. sp. tritici]|uniref:Uncharacterized protein n=1 Tax=Puccinia graminis f. sp. tritici TaxID=56615 RepID=A0A5B0QXD9_PUCGR|nr:hypothetical protein PGT21_028745 [Puccinia graminis f. sp. tritici]
MLPILLIFHLCFQVVRQSSAAEFSAVGFSHEMNEGLTVECTLESHKPSRGVWNPRANFKTEEQEIQAAIEESLKTTPSHSLPSRPELTQDQPCTSSQDAMDDYHQGFSGFQEHVGPSSNPGKSFETVVQEIQAAILESLKANQPSPARQIHSQQLELGNEAISPPPISRSSRAPSGSGPAPSHPPPLRPPLPHPEPAQEPPTSTQEPIDESHKETGGTGIQEHVGLQSHPSASFDTEQQEMQAVIEESLKTSQHPPPVGKGLVSQGPSCVASLTGEGKGTEEDSRASNASPPHSPPSDRPGHKPSVDYSSHQPLTDYLEGSSGHTSSRPMNKNNENLTEDQALSHPKQASTQEVSQLPPLDMARGHDSEPPWVPLIIGLHILLFFWIKGFFG